MNELLFFLQIATVVLFAFVFKRLGKEALIAWMAVQVLLANVFVLKQMQCFGLNVTCSDAFSIGCLLSLNLLREQFGKKVSLKAIWVCFATMIFFVGVNLLHLQFIPLSYEVQQAYEMIFKPQLRLVLASLASFFIVQQFDMRFFGWIKEKTALSFSWRNLICLLVSQLFDTLLFTTLGLLGYIESFMDVVVMSFCVKAIAIITGNLFIPLIHPKPSLENESI